jgi:hypothetical protein
MPECWNTRTVAFGGYQKAMSENDSAADKRNAVEYLNFGAKTQKRVTWEAWEFAVEAPHLIRVTNASYGFEKADHSYLVGVEDCDGVLVPAECECPADMYRDDYDCKHKLALAVVGGPVVLGAAVDYPTEINASSRESELRADGGATTEGVDGEANNLDAVKPDECIDSEGWCPGPDGDSLPCFACFKLVEER